MTTCIRSFLRTIRLVVNQSTFPVMEFHERVIFLSFAMLCKTVILLNRDVRYTVMILYIICQLVCVTDLWAHMSLVHSILSLKLGVTVGEYYGPKFPFPCYVTRFNYLQFQLASSSFSCLGLHLHA
jgi:hypothetical protein